MRTGFVFLGTVENWLPKEIRVQAKLFTGKSGSQGRYLCAGKTPILLLLVRLTPYLNLHVPLLYSVVLISQQSILSSKIS